MTRRDRTDIATDMQRAMATQQDSGAEYAVAVGLIQGIQTAAPYGTYAGLTDKEKLAEIDEVLAALDIVTAKPEAGESR